MKDMTLAKLKELADDESVNVTLSQPDSGIGRVYFSITGVKMKAQFDTDNPGIYAPGFAEAETRVYEFLAEARDAIEKATDRHHQGIDDKVIANAIEIADDASLNLIQSHCQSVSIAPGTISQDQLGARTGYDLESIDADTNLEPDLTYALKRGLLARVPGQPKIVYAPISTDDGDSDEVSTSDDDERIEALKEIDDGS